MISLTDLQRLIEATSVAQIGQMTTPPNPAVGCVLVQKDRVIGVGAHRQTGGAHAEVLALDAAKGHSTKGACAYVTLEPCNHTGRTPPCTQALIQSGVSRVVIGMLDPNPKVSGCGVAALRQAGIEVQVLGQAPAQVEQSQINALIQSLNELNQGYLKWHRTGRPLVRLKLAASLDGRTAMASGESRWITGPEARADVHRLRAVSGAIVTGVATVLADSPLLTVRPQEHGIDYPEGLGAFAHADQVRQPLRVILDSAFQVTDKHPICQQPGQTLILGLDAHQGQGVVQDSVHPCVPISEIDDQLMAEHKVLRGYLSSQKSQLSKKPQQVDLDQTLALLARLAINSVMVESGAILAGAFIAANLVDQLWLYQAPLLLGDRAKPLARFDCEFLSQAPRWVCVSEARFGQDRRFIFEPAGS